MRGNTCDTGLCLFDKLAVCIYYDPCARRPADSCVRPELETQVAVIFFVLIRLVRTNNNYNNNNGGILKTCFSHPRFFFFFFLLFFLFFGQSRIFNDFHL